MTIEALPSGSLRTFREELRKIPAFFRRDFLVLWSYRLAFFSDWFSLGIQVLTFYFVGRLVSPDLLPTIDGIRISYVQFVTVGIILTTVLQVGLGRLVAIIRQEQFMGTLETLLLSPTSPTTWQLGSVVFDLIYVPLRTTLFLVIVSNLLDAPFRAAGLMPALVVLLCFLPLVWGLGMISAAGVLTFRRGSGAIGLASTLMILASGAYFPTTLLPDWLMPLVRLNPIAIVIDAMRTVLLGAGGWADIWPAVAKLTPVAVVFLAVGNIAFRMALERERRRGTLGMY